MSDRWWAPTRPTVTPDAVVLAMCEPGDLGAALLAAHRAGAASIETVAASALPCEETLINALVAGRGHFVPPVHEAIAKKLEPIYSDLLLRDWLDAAEQSAMTIYRTAVTKGVTPSVAATRAGQVYGVPARELGSYFTKAIDPKTPPAWLVQEADRVLMEHVASVVATEATEAAEVVTKATMSGGEFKETDVVRDVKGRFAEEHKPAVGSPEWLKLQFRNSGAPPRVGDLKREETKEAEPTVATERKMRSPRSPRLVRSPRSPRGPETAEARPREREGRTREKAVRTRSERAQAKRAQADNSKKFIDKQRETAPPPSLGGAGPMEPFPVSGEVWETMKPNLTITVTDAYADELLAKIGSTDGHFRMGHLLTPGSAAAPAQDQANENYRIGAAGQVHDDAIRRARERDAPEYNTPDVTEYTPQEITRGMRDTGRRSGVDWVEFKRIQKAEALSKDWNEDPYTRALPNYSPEGDEEAADDAGWSVVHYQGDGNKRAMPSVDEFVIENEARGTIEGGTRNMHILLDPNQTYMLTKLTPETMWDASANIAVNRWHIKAVDDDTGYFGKATADQHRFRETDVVRDENGRFAPEGDGRNFAAEISAQMKQTEVATPRSRREARSPRSPRAMRSPRSPQVHASPLRTPAERSRATRERRTRDPAQRQMAQRMQAHLTRQISTRPRRESSASGVDLPMLAPELDYQVFASAEWNDVAFHLDADLGSPGDSVSLTDRQREILMEGPSAGTVSIDMVPAHLVDNILVREQGGYMTKPLRQANLDRLYEDPKAMERYLDNVGSDIASAGPRLHRVEVETKGNIVSVRGAFVDEVDELQTLVQIAEDYDSDSPAYLSYVGTMAANDLGTYDEDGNPLALVGGDYTLDGHIPTAPVRIYRLSARPWEPGN